MAIGPTLIRMGWRDGVRSLWDRPHVVLILRCGVIQAAFVAAIPSSEKLAIVEQLASGLLVDEAHATLPRHMATMQKITSMVRSYIWLNLSTDSPDFIDKMQYYSDNGSRPNSPPSRSRELDFQSMQGVDHGLLAAPEFMDRDAVLAMLLIEIGLQSLHPFCQHLIVRLDRFDVRHPIHL